MLKHSKTILTLYIVFTVFIVIFISLSLLFTYKFNNKFRKFYAIFLDTNTKDSIVLGTIILNLIYVFYFMFNLDVFSTFGFYLVIVNTLISLLLCFNIHYFLANLIYDGMVIFSLFVLKIVNDYLNKVFFDNQTNILRILLCILIGVFVVFNSIRKLELVVRKHRLVRRNV